MNNLKDQINKIDLLVEELEKSDLTPGIKSDLIGLQKEFKDKATALLPIYENIVEIQESIVRPTNEKINNSFTELRKDNRTSNKYNFALSIISIIFGLIGIILTLKSVTNEVKNQPENTALIAEGEINDKDQKSTNIDRVTVTEKILSNYKWITEIDYKYEKSIFHICDRFKIYISSNEVRITLDMDSQKLTSDISISSEELIRLTELINKYIYIIIGKEKMPVLTKYYTTILGGVEIKFTYDSLDRIPDIQYERNGSCFIKLIDESSVITRFTDSSLKLGINPKNTIEAVSSLIYYLTKQKMVIDFDTTSNNIVLYDSFGGFNHLIMFKPIK